jgi:hypothetical protein
VEKLYSERKWLNNRCPVGKLIKDREREPETSRTANIILYAKYLPQRENLQVGIEAVPSEAIKLGFLMGQMGCLSVWERTDIEEHLADFSFILCKIR